MFNVILVEPEIPSNTGNIIRLCVNTGAQLHLVEPLGFQLNDAKMRRAGLDYLERISMKVHRNWDTLIKRETVSAVHRFAFTTRSPNLLHQYAFTPGDWFVFGPETRGLSAEFLAQFQSTQCIRLPMMPGNRSLNLSNAVAITVFEAWRQHDFKGGV